MSTSGLWCVINLEREQNPPSMSINESEGNTYRPITPNDSAGGALSEVASGEVFSGGNTSALKFTLYPAKK